jgi:DNA-binding HxlR family transcriptional regulator
MNQLIVNSAIARGLDVIGDRWSLLILRDAFLGHCRFDEFRRLSGVSKATLSRRLDALIAEDVFYKKAYSASGTRFEYRLTPKGNGLFASSLLCWQWELEWAKADQLPQQLLHKTCGQPLAPKAVCQHCRQAFGVDDVELPEQADGTGKQFDEIQSLNKQRRVRSTILQGEEGQALADVSNLIGDRWTLLLLIAAFFGTKRYDAFLKQLNIATNILTERLKMLVEVEILERRHYQESPPRSDYQLTAKGQALYPIVMAMRQWVIDYLPEAERGANIIHKSCGKPLVVDIQCAHCEQYPKLLDVDFVE